MNDKENEFFRILDIVIRCCCSNIRVISREDIIGKSRAEYVVMTRAIFVAQIIAAGYCTSSIADFLKRDIHTIRHIRAQDAFFLKSSRAYRIASCEASRLCKVTDQ